jgi:hypothetical protein
MGKKEKTLSMFDGTKEELENKARLDVDSLFPNKESISIQEILSQDLSLEYKRWFIFTHCELSEEEDRYLGTENYSKTSLEVNPKASITSTLRRFSLSTFLFSSGSLSTCPRNEHNC